MSGIIVIGGGIAGLSLALGLKQRGVACRVYESAPEVRELGVGITLLPHAMREFIALGLEDRLRTVAIENEESVFFNRHGQFIYREPRGRHAGYPFPELGIHRGKLHRILYEAARERLGPANVLIDHHCTGVEQDERGVTAFFKATSSGAARDPVRGDIAVACDGINSVVRRKFYPDEKIAFAGINTWRGVTRRKPILSGRTYMRIGSVETGKMVIYPIVDDVDGDGNQLINWMAEVRQGDVAMNDWNKPGRRDDFLPLYQSWRFDWLDVPELIAKADQILEYPMVDKDPVSRWTFGRITLMGDAAHPMYPRGSNGAAQGAIDARTLADLIVNGPDLRTALLAYQEARLEATARVVRTNREFPPDFINIKVDELTGGERFERIDDVISQDELRAISERYKQIAGFALDALQPGN
ncbi:MAG: flavin-dependent oxidoreductase [Gammaproteobacteria bacterium]|nr:flavin-dependent oxidoreductase [Gammaproteobacteria bacterium]